MKAINVKTPHGYRHHGDIGVRRGVNDLVFRRVVNSFKDKMRIFDAYSIHPDALEQIKKEGVRMLHYIEDGKNHLELEVVKLEKMLSGEIKHQGCMLAWEGEFGGGKTIYIKRLAFNGVWKLTEWDIKSDKPLPQPMNPQKSLF